MGLNRDFITLARSIQLEIAGKNANLINDKQSHYNSQVIMDSCQICKGNSEHVHHIKEQKDADKDGNIHYFHKNIKHNLVSLCEKCHHKVHNGNLRIYGYYQTNEGIQLNYEYIEIQKAQKENSKKKFTEKDIRIIRKCWENTS